MIHSALNMMQICEGFNIIGSQAGRESDWIEVTNYKGIVFVVNAIAGVADNDITLSLHQSKDNVGNPSGAVKPLPARRWYSKSGANLSAIGKPTEHVTDNGNLVIEGSENNLAYVEVDASELDVSAGYKFVNLRTAGGAAGKTINCIALAVNPRYMNAPEKLPAALG